MTEEVKQRAFRAVNYILKDLNIWRQCAAAAIQDEANGAKWEKPRLGYPSCAEDLLQLHKAGLYAYQVTSTLNMAGHSPGAPDDLVDDIMAYLAVLRDTLTEEEKLRAVRILRQTTWTLVQQRREIMHKVTDEARGEPWKNKYFPTSLLAIKFYTQTVGIIAEAQTAY